jgi:DNA-binding SARP family transcriptional activator
MEFRLLGPLEVHEEGRVVPLGAAKQRSLLGVLLLHANEMVSVDRLVDELWGERPPARSTKLVQGYVSELRKRLGADRVVTRRPGYLVRVERSELDSVEFERLVARARSERPEEAARRLREALALWRGPALADVTLEGFAAREAERLNELRFAALLDRIEADLTLGRHAELVGELEALIAEHPLRERLRGQMMLALYRAGRQAEALQVYREARRMLTEELAIDPSVELQSLEKAILNQDPALAGPLRSAQGTSPVRQLPSPLRLTPPYPFVGRSRELTTLRTLGPRASAEGRRIALVGGEAGSGKSRSYESSRTK